MAPTSQRGKGKRSSVNGDEQKIKLARAAAIVPAGEAESSVPSQVTTGESAPSLIVSGVECEAGEEEGDEQLDSDCDPRHPKTITADEIVVADFEIKNYMEATPCTKSQQLSRLSGMELYFKKEFLLQTGSFKERGVIYALCELSEEQKRIGVIAASAGNHALALCYYGSRMNIPVTVVMPTFAPLMKISLCESFGATIILRGTNIIEAKVTAMEVGRTKGFKYINGYDAPNILRGQGSVGLEIMKQVHDVDAILIPVGGGGLIAGVATAVKKKSPKVLIYGVEAESCPSFSLAYKAGKIVKATVESTLADGLAVPTVGGNSLSSAKGKVDRMILVNEESIGLAILRLIEIEKAVVEGAGAVTLAAILSGKVPELQGKKVVAILSGGNIDTTVLSRSIERGLAVDGRLARLEVVVSDRPGGIKDLTALIANVGASIKDIFHERAWIKTDVFSVKAKVIVETRDRDHIQQLEAALRAKYSDVVVS